MMNDVFVEWGATIEPREMPISSGIDLTIEFFRDGYHLSYIEWYDGPVMVEVATPKLMEQTQAVLQMMHQQNWIMGNFQVQKITVVQSSSYGPRSAFQNRCIAPVEEAPPTGGAVVDYIQTTTPDPTQQFSADEVAYDPTQPVENQAWSGDIPPEVAADIASDDAQG